MYFKMNDRNWEIVESSSEYLLKEYLKEYNDATYCFGLTRYSKQKIYLNEELHPEQKKQTLYHELMHCYVWCYIHGFNEISEEALCDISANSHDIIHKIVEDYFQPTKSCKINLNLPPINLPKVKITTKSSMGITSSVDKG